MEINKWIYSVVMKINLFLFFMLVLVISTLAQSNRDEVDKLAIECSNGNIESCKKIEDIALHDESPAIRVNAVEKITDQNILIEIAKNDKEYSVRLTAVKKITDQNILTEILNNDKNGWVRKTALKKITDQNIIIDIAKNDKSYIMRETAVLKINDQDVLSDIALMDASYIVRKAAFTKIYKQDILNIKKINNKSFLVDIVKNEPNREIRNAAYKKTTDQNLLLEIAKNGRYPENQLVALNSLSVNENYKQIIDIIGQNIHSKNNFKNIQAIIGALKIMPLDKTLMNHYEILKVEVKIEGRAIKYQISEWQILDFSINIKTNKFTKSFSYTGQRGGTRESYSDIGKMHMGQIDIDEICQFLLSPLSKGDLLKISNESDVLYLRETAKSLLQK